MACASSSARWFESPPALSEVSASMALLASLRAQHTPAHPGAPCQAAQTPL